LYTAFNRLKESVDPHGENNIIIFGIVEILMKNLGVKTSIAGAIGVSIRSETSNNTGA